MPNLPKSINRLNAVYLGDSLQPKSIHLKTLGEKLHCKSLPLGAVQTPPPRKPTKRWNLPREGIDHSLRLFKLPPPQRMNTWSPNFPCSFWFSFTPLCVFLGKHPGVVPSIITGCLLIWFDLVLFGLLHHYFGDPMGGALFPLAQGYVLKNALLTWALHQA